MNRHINSMFEGEKSKFPEATTNEFFPKDTGASLRDLFQRFETNGGKPIELSFREMVPWVFGGSRATHYLHSYPAKLLPQIAHYFLSNEELCPRGGVVLDPFCGSGTVALETILSGRTAYFCDVNPFARLLTAAKTFPVDAEELDNALSNVRELFEDEVVAEPVDVVNLSYWYNEITVENLKLLKTSILRLEEDPQRRLLLICFSTLARKLSRANPRFSVPVRLKVDGQHVDVVASKAHVWSIFHGIVEKAKRQTTELRKIRDLRPAISVSENVLHLDKKWPTDAIPYGGVDLVVTSPPYAGAQKYVRATSLSLGWLDQTKSSGLRSIESLTLGREHLTKNERNKLVPTSIPAANQLIESIYEVNSTRAFICSNFLNEMKIAAEMTMGALKSNGYAVVITADNTVCGRRFPTTDYICELFAQAGGKKKLEISDRIVSRSLQTKRASTSSSIGFETITVFRKE